mgnify:CR=1 FL=1
MADTRINPLEEETEELSTYYVELVHERVANPAGVSAVLGPTAAANTPITIRATGAYPDDTSLLVATFGRPDLVPVASVGPEMLLSLNAIAAGLQATG